MFLLIMFIEVIQQTKQVYFLLLSMQMVQKKEFASYMLIG